METDAQSTCRPCRRLRRRRRHHRRYRTPIIYVTGVVAHARKGMSANDICGWLGTRVTTGARARGTKRAKGKRNGTVGSMKTHVSL